MPEKLDAIARGDLSGRIVHPSFVHFAHIIGCVYYRDDNGQRVPSDFEASYYQVVMRYLEDKESFTPVEFLQTCIFLGTYRYLNNQFDTAWDCGTKAYDMIINADMHITLPSTDCTGSRSPQNVAPGRYGHIQALDEADEQRTLLCYAMHGDFCAILIWDRPVVLPAHLDDELRSLFVRNISLPPCIYAPSSD